MKTSCALAQMIIKNLILFLLTISIMVGLVSCTQPAVIAPTPDLPPYTMRLEDVPGITQEEMDAIAALREKYDYLTYGIPMSTEAFVTETGEIGGFTALITGWMTQVLDLEIRPVIIEFPDLLTALDNNEVDFAGGLAPSEERKKTYLMTDPITERSLKFFRLKDAAHFSDVIEERSGKIAFLKGSATMDLALSLLPTDAFTPVLIEYNEDAIDLLLQGEIDGFIHQNTTEIVFEDYVEIVSDDFYPPAFIPVAFTGKRAELAPIISVIEKALTQENRARITRLYRQGERDYKQSRFLRRLTEEERRFIEENPVIPMVAEFDNYPFSFYNRHIGEWQGIYQDHLVEISALTGLEFQIINETDEEWDTSLNRVVTGEAYLITDLVKTSAKEGHFLWSTGNLMESRPAFISKDTYHYIDLNEILFAKIGVTKDSSFAELLHQWFPYASAVIEYPQQEDTFNALIDGEVDLVLASETALLYFTVYRELPGYKLNYIFDYMIHSTFGFNLEQGVLASIIDKSLDFIDSETINQQWALKTFDYRVVLLEAQQPWIISAAVFLLVSLALLIVLLIRRQIQAKRLKIFQNDVLGIMADLIENRDVTTGKHIFNTQRYLKCLIDKCLEMNIYKEEIQKWNMDELLLSSQLHDVGKITISDTILNKKTALNDDEFEVMKTHTVKGADIANHLEDSIHDSNFFRYVKSFAASHHEKWDGTGYPEGLKGLEIPLESRLLAIADVYDALVSARSYKKGMSSEEAADIVIMGSGTQFDPKLIQVFKKARKDFEKIDRM